MRISLLVLFILYSFSLLSQKDTVWIGLYDYVITDTLKPVNYDSLFTVKGKFVFTYDYYKKRYKEENLMYKITDNKGNGFDSLYGTRNMRPILHGVAYRGGANNYYHLTDKRHNHNPIPLDGMNNLCKEGFSKGVYLYRENFENSPIGDTCNCANGSWNKFEYYQKDYYDSSHVYDMLKMVYESIIYDSIGPVYLHCWNGWHASGYISAVILKQFCNYSDWDAVNYWDIGTDGANTSPRYQHQRERIKAFKPYKEFMISDSLQQCLCPPMPEHIDSTQLHIEIEHLVIVPEAIPVGYQIVLYNVKFGPNKTSFANISNHPDIVNLKKALDADQNLKIEIGGYTDNSGSYAKNVNLSKQRAKFVYDHLIASGYSADRISYAGYGPAKPIYSNRYKSTRAGNRRIEVKILQKTIHSANKLVDENVVVTATTSDDEKKYLSYFFSHPQELLQSNFIIDSLIFESSSAALPDTTNEGVQLLNLLVDYLNNHKHLKIVINGYTDASGIPEKNKILSEQRAKAVYDYLVSKGVRPNRLIYRGHGANNPIATNTYKWGRDLNRRVEVEFVSD
ncbi:MAG TPA: OmpA family protein [Crocinitomix sp.]|nr:OmpA family protein [Crocinitomix sp.]